MVRRHSQRRFAGAGTTVGVLEEGVPMKKPVQLLQIVRPVKARSHKASLSSTVSDRR
jgi:hypothetical protein